VSALISQALFFNAAEENLEMTGTN
jgi:hypothetical protein